MGSMFIPAAGQDGALADATARLAAVQAALKEMKELEAAMQLDALDARKHLEYIEARLHSIEKDLRAVGLTSTRKPTSSGIGSGETDG